MQDELPDGVTRMVYNWSIQSVGPLLEMETDRWKKVPPLRHQYAQIRYELDPSSKTIHMRSFKDATGAPHVMFKENPILINELGYDTLNRSGGPGALHASGNTAFLEEAKWHVIKMQATPLPELIITGPSSASWPSSKHHAPGNTVWFNSESPEDLAIPGPINLMPDIGTVYIHRNTVNGLL
ncbi:hypothetical protein F5146DRAFT_1145617 [Armillaria mellea]|nr:hypothetical protein F5146DRAFT_1145617 [Armillaria mellea]